ncbi:60S ribosomal protein L36 [Pteropus alecto]|uniref:Large ribosomal subunit protein eL36 n=1 Tax=Pteropus alecto TaxID=9402 RepID=L5KS09_PTEAL|nr:60S ribosomal protein L36 [Pteropus alecto]
MAVLRHGYVTKHTKSGQSIIRETCGFASFKRRAIDLFKVSKPKQALKFIKKTTGHTSVPRGRERS